MTTADARLLCLDLASVSGWAAGTAGGSVAFGSNRIAPAGASEGEFMLRAASWLKELMIVTAPRVIAYERPLDPRRMGGATNERTFRRLISICHLSEMVAHGLGIYDVREVETADVRRYFIGGNPKREEAKKLTMRKCRVLGHEPMDDNAADAIAIFYFMAGAMNPRLAHLSTDLFGSKRK